MTDDDETILTDVDIEVGFRLDTSGVEWVKPTLASPDSPQRFSLAYSRDDAQHFEDLLQGIIDRLS
jgi:hypothetical protein